MANKTSAAQIGSTERQREAIALRKAGYTLEEIGDALGIHKSSVHELIDRALTTFREDIAKGADELRALEVARMDRLLIAIWQAASKGDLKAIDRTLKIAERRARLLGLDAPTKIAQTDVDGQQSYGVLVVPGAMTPEQWNEAAAGQRKKITDATASD